MARLCQCPVCQKNDSVTAAAAGEKARCQGGPQRSFSETPTRTECPAEFARHGIPSLLYGTLYSLIGSGSVAALWGGVALVSQIEVGWMAWGLGAMSGFGMACKHAGGRGTWAGIIAATMTLVGILVAKIAVFLAVLVPILRRIDGDLIVAATPRLFLSTMFDPIDGLFTFLAVATAFRLGSQTDECD